jgi:ParB-like chromosome segregation protein Spo0J
MSSFGIQTLEADLHRLDLRFASLRVRQPRAVERLARSIAHSGQLMPVVAVEEQARWVLIDGYLRIEALRRLSRDTARVELWECPLAQALLLVLVRVQGRAWEAIEEGAVIRELVGQCGLSRREVARQTGRDASWVSRRLTLVEDLPEAVFAAVCAGELSTWAAVRVLAPLARANTEQAQTLLAALQREPLSAPASCAPGTNTTRRPTASNASACWLNRTCSVRPCRPIPASNRPGCCGRDRKGRGWWRSNASANACGDWVSRFRWCSPRRRAPRCAWLGWSSKPLCVIWTKS